MCKGDKYSSKKLTLDGIFGISIVTTCFILATCVYIGYTMLDQTVDIRPQLCDERFILIVVAWACTLVTIGCLCYMYRCQLIFYQIIRQGLIDKTSTIFGISTRDSVSMLE
jgi:hypothetical protein